MNDQSESTLKVITEEPKIFDIIKQTNNRKSLLSQYHIRQSIMSDRKSMQAANFDD